MRQPLPSHRPAGTGSIHAARHGGVEAYSPRDRPGGKVKIGKFPSRHHAQKALDKWLADNPAPMKEH
jgi:hypothetical protein